MLTCVGLWRIWKHPDPNPALRQFERFLCAWFLLGLLLFCFAAHQRGRLIFPLIPGAALIAGRELARFTQKYSRARFLQTTVLLTLLTLGGFTLYHLVLIGRNAKVRKVWELKQFAAELNLKPGTRVVHLDSPAPLHLFLHAPRGVVTVEQAAELLSAKDPVVVTVSDSEKLEKITASKGVSWLEIGRWPVSGKPAVRAFSNKPKTEVSGN